MPQQQALMSKALQVRGRCPQDRACPSPQTSHAIRDGALRNYRYALPEKLQALGVCARGTCALALLLGNNSQ